MARRSNRQKRILLILIAVAVLACLLFEFVGPGFDRLAQNLGLSPAPVTVEGELEVHFLDVGNADCTLVRQGEHTLLIDAGERGDSEEILEYLSQNGVSKLDLVVATHAHADHIGSMAKVINALPVGRFVMAFMPESETPTTATYLDMLEALDEKAVPIDEAVPGAVYEVGAARLQVLAPIEESKETNDMSVVTRLTFGEKAFLFTGDAGTAVEEDILASGYPLQADVLKVAHHGSTTGNSKAFLEAVNPAYCLIPCGEDNSYGHPHREVLLLLDKLETQVYRSDVHGHVVFTSDGKTLTVETEEE